MENVDKTEESKEKIKEKPAKLNKDGFVPGEAVSFEDMKKAESKRKKED